MYIRRMSRSAVTLAMILAGLWIGSLIGCINIHCSEAPWESLTYVLLALALAYVRPKLLWLWPLIFAFTLYAVHIWAIRHGYRQPYVEKDEDHALNCLEVFFPAFLGASVGGGIRLLVNWVRTEAG